MQNKTENRQNYKKCEKLTVSIIFIRKYFKLYTPICVLLLSISALLAFRLHVGVHSEYIIFDDLYDICQFVSEIIYGR